MALFIFKKLEENNAKFDKLVSITTDGASNMLGKDNGMVRTIRHLIDQKLIVRNGSLSLVHSVWCFAHRLNLVLKDVISSNPIDIVKAFCDWFTIKRRQVRYKTFIQTQFPSVQVRVIPQPSETRWLFYHDVVNAILTQPTVIQSFLNKIISNCL